jgi:hypothetical protein
LFFPAGANYAIGVSATDSSNNKAFFSNYGDIVDIAAPGESILSLVPTYGSAYFVSNYHTLSGTSMATPHVSALAGLLAGSTANLSAAAIAQRLQQAADSTIAMGGWDPNLGYGALNAWRALSGTLRQASAGGITGQVTDSAALPIENAVVSAGGQSVTTSTSGLFRFSNLTAGSYTVSATAAGFPARTLTTTAVAGADVTLTIAMGGTFGTLSGTVTGSGGPLAGAAVEALSGGSIKATASTGADGQYSLSVPPGTYDVRASRMSRITSTVSGQAVAANSTTTVNLALARMGSITGLVRDLNNNLLANAQVTAAGAGFSGGGLTDANGNYTTIGLPAGTYTVTASGSGLQDQTVTGVAVSNDADTTLNFQVDVWTISPVSPSAATLRANQTQQFATTVYPANQTAIWSLSPTVGTISSNGLYTAPADIPAFQTVTVKATHSADSTVTSSATLTLAPTLTLTVTPTSVVGGVATTGNRVTLDSPAPAGGAVVALASSNSSAAAVPATVGVAAGETTANFTITTAAVAAAAAAAPRADPLPQGGADRVARAHAARGPQPAGAADDGRGGAPDAASRARRDRPAAPARARARARRVAAARAGRGEGALRERRGEAGERGEAAREQAGLGQEAHHELSLAGLGSQVEERARLDEYAALLEQALRERLVGLARAHPQDGGPARFARQRGDGARRRQRREQRAILGDAGAQRVRERLALRQQPRERAREERRDGEEGVGDELEPRERVVPRRRRTRGHDPADLELR